MDDKLDNPFDVLNERLKRIAMLLENQKKPTNQKHRAQDKSIELAIAITGLKKKTIYNLAYKRLIPHSKRGKRLYFDEVELNQWISNGQEENFRGIGTNAASIHPYLRIYTTSSRQLTNYFSTGFYALTVTLFDLTLWFILKKCGANFLKSKVCLRN